MTVVGARPQFVKAAPVSAALSAAGIHEYLVHTGQHYDDEMSAAFFTELGLPEADENLGIGSASHGAQTGAMLARLEEVMLRVRSALVLVFGDTNSTLSGALAAAKLRVPVAHVEAGLRSFNRGMPEEINRVLTDHLSEMLFAPTDAAVANLAAEGITSGVVRTGDVMYDVALRFRPRVSALAPSLLERFRVTQREFAFATVHRAENTDDHGRWHEIVESFKTIAENGLPIIWAAHPRTRRLVRAIDAPGLHVVPPLPYLETQALVRAARVVITDSGGLQKEAAFHSVPCVTVREETEWVELIGAGVNVLAGLTRTDIVDAVSKARWPDGADISQVYGTGRTAEEIAGRLRWYLDGDRERQDKRSRDGSVL